MQLREKKRWNEYMEAQLREIMDKVRNFNRLEISRVRIRKV